MSTYDFLSKIQLSLEQHYRAHTGLDVLDFLKTVPQLSELGTLLVEHDHNQEDLNIALLLDRDILAAWNPGADTPHQQSARCLSISFEEVSHFVYLSFNHQCKRNITALEMEVQSEVDRIFLAFHGQLEVSPSQQKTLLSELFDKHYTQASYEKARVIAANFIYRLSGGKPNAWSPAEFAQLRKFFHSDLAEKLRLAKK